MAEVTRGLDFRQLTKALADYRSENVVLKLLGDFRIVKTEAEGTVLHFVRQLLKEKNEFRGMKVKTATLEIRRRAEATILELLKLAGHGEEGRYYAEMIISQDTLDSPSLSWMATAFRLKFTVEGELRENDYESLVEILIAWVEGTSVELSAEELSVDPDAWFLLNYWLNRVARQHFPGSIYYVNIPYPGEWHMPRAPEGEPPVYRLSVAFSVVPYIPPVAYVARKYNMREKFEAIVSSPLRETVKPKQSELVRFVNKLFKEHYDEIRELEINPKKIFKEA